MQIKLHYWLVQDRKSSSSKQHSSVDRSLYLRCCLLAAHAKIIPTHIQSVSQLNPDSRALRSRSVLLEIAKEWQNAEEVE